MVATAPKLFTVEDLLELPGDVRCELIEGELVELSPTQEAHVVVASRLNEELVVYFRSHREIGALWIGEGGYIVRRGPDTVLAPDLAVVGVDQTQGRGPRGTGFLSFVPMIPVEVKSPSDSEARIARRLALYLEAGAREVWWARPTNQTITVHRPDGPIDLLRVGDALTSHLLPGFRLELSDLFADG